MFTKDEIIFAALNIVRKNGMSALTARALGNELGSSSKPVFSIFDNMSEVQNAVLDAANREYQGYIEEFVKNHKKFSFRNLLERQGSKMEIIVTFLAVLEMMKQGILSVEQEDTFGDIMITSSLAA